MLHWIGTQKNLIQKMVHWIGTLMTGAYTYVGRYPMC